MLDQGAQIRILTTLWSTRLLTIAFLTRADPSETTHRNLLPCAAVAGALAPERAFTTNITADSSGNHCRTTRRLMGVAHDVQCSDARSPSVPGGTTTRVELGGDYVG